MEACIGYIFWGLVGQLSRMGSVGFENAAVIGKGSSIRGRHFSVTKLGEIIPERYKKCPQFLEVRLNITKKSL